MLIVIDPHSGVPVYRQIVDQVGFQIASGLLAAEQPLPSTRALSQELGINPMTVSKAYGLLEEAGLLVRRPGLPLVVRTRTPAADRDARESQLLAVLEPAALAARQLGIGEASALALFRQALTESTDAKERAG